MDLTVPGGMGGMQTLQHIRSLDDRVVAIVSSGYANAPILADYRNHGFSARLATPFLPEDLAQVLATLLPDSIPFPTP